MRNHSTKSRLKKSPNLFSLNKLPIPLERYFFVSKRRKIYQKSKELRINNKEYQILVNKELGNKNINLLESFS